PLRPAGRPLCRDVVDDAPDRRLELERRRVPDGELADMSLHSLEMSFQLAEAVVPELHVWSQPALDLGEPLAAQRVESSLSLGVGLDQAGFAQDPQVA